MCTGTTGAKLGFRPMPVFTFETNAPSTAISVWSVECDCPEHARRQAALVFADLVRGSVDRLSRGGPLSLWVSDRSGQVLFKLHLTVGAPEAQGGGNAGLDQTGISVAL